MARRDKRGRDAAILVAIAAVFAAVYFHVRSDTRAFQALVQAGGEPRFVAVEWALSGNEPRWLPCDRRGADYYTPYPPGWVEPPPAFGRPGRSCCCDTEGRAQGNAR
jgi:hypothetical protein